MTTDKDSINYVWTFIVMLLILSIFGFILAVPLVAAWNFVMPVAFGLGTLTYMQMWCLYFVLTSLWKVAVVSVPKTKQ